MKLSGTILLRLSVALASVVLLSGCSGDITGTVFVKMRSGDIKRRADVEVVLVQASSQFETEWKKAAEAYSKAGEDVEQLREESEAAYRAYRADILNDSKKARWEAAYTKELARLPVDAAQREHALKLIQWAKKGVTRTTVDGRFLFADVSKGKYYVYAQYHDANNVVEWMVPVDVAGGSQKVDLSNSNSGRLLAAR
jgi:hypothetical protein